MFFDKMLGQPESFLFGSAYLFSLTGVEKKKSFLNKADPQCCTWKKQRDSCSGVSWCVHSFLQCRDDERLLLLHWHAADCGVSQICCKQTLEILVVGNGGASSGLALSLCAPWDTVVTMLIGASGTRGTVKQRTKNQTLLFQLR